MLKVEELGGGKFLVESESAPESFYRVDTTEPSCQCKAFQHKGGCKHLTLLAEQNSEQEIGELPTLYTARWSNRHLESGEYAPVRTTLGAPKFPIPYEYDHFKALSPQGWMMKLNEDDFARAYRVHLDRTGLKFLIGAFKLLGARNGWKPLTLLCFEDVHGGEFCHRRVFAEWWEEKTGQKVEELEEPGRVPEPESLF